MGTTPVKALLWLVVALAPTVAAQTPDTAGQVPQRDLMDVARQVLGREPDTTAAIPDSTAEVSASAFTFALLPAISVNPATGLLLGISASAIGRNRPTAPPAAIYASVSYTTKQQLKLALRGNVYSQDGKWAFGADWRYHDNNQPTYGLGPAPPSSEKHDMDFKQVRLSQTVARKLTGRLYAGAGYHLEAYFDIADLDTVPGELTPFQEYSGVGITHTLSSGLSGQLLYDSRDNPAYPTRGQYASAAFYLYPTWLGSDNTWQAMILEGRIYPRVGGRVPWEGILGLWGRTWFTLGRPPYMELPSIGWDPASRTGRGYVQGRIRAENLVYLEAEYRVNLSQDGLWGAVAFLNFTSASDPTTRSLQNPNIGGGVGLRVKLNKASHTNITLDWGLAAGGSRGLFLGTGEAF
jgi:hypothetical protein